METLSELYKPSSKNTLTFLSGGDPGGGGLKFLRGKDGQNSELFYITDAYTPEEIELWKESLYFEYICKTYNIDQNIRVIDFTEFQNNYNKFLGSNAISVDFPNELVDLLKPIGYSGEKIVGRLSSKGWFQSFARETIGIEHTTKPKIIKAKKTIEDLKRLLKEPGRYCIRIDDQNFEGAGSGVRFISSYEEAIQVLSTMKVLDNDKLKYAILVEKDYEFIASPSTTFFINDDGNIEFLSTNRQYLDNGKFLASTNILDPQTESKSRELEILGTQLARQAALLGARGFIGFDWGITKDGKLIVTEANIRETGSVIGHFISRRVSNFKKDMEWMYFFHVPYTEKTNNFPGLLKKLREGHHLFEGIGIDNDFTEPKVVIDYAMRPNGKSYCLVIFWEKTNDKANKFKTVNGILKRIGSNTKIS